MKHKKIALFFLILFSFNQSLTMANILSWVDFIFTIIDRSIEFSMGISITILIGIATISIIKCLTKIINKENQIFFTI